MGRRPKSAEIRARFWSARASGATLREAAAAAGVSKTTGHYWLRDSGGNRARAWRPRPQLRLSLAEREEISPRAGGGSDADRDRSSVGSVGVHGQPGGAPQQRCHLIFVKGSVPGSKGGWLLVKDAVKVKRPDAAPYPAGLRAANTNTADVATADVTADGQEG